MYILYSSRWWRTFTPRSLPLYRGWSVSHQIPCFPSNPKPELILISLPRGEIKIVSVITSSYKIHTHLRTLRWGHGGRFGQYLNQYFVFQGILWIVFPAFLPSLLYSLFPWKPHTYHHTPHALFPSTMHPIRSPAHPCNPSPSAISLIPLVSTVHLLPSPITAPTMVHTGNWSCASLAPF